MRKQKIINSCYLKRILLAFILCIILCITPVISASADDSNCTSYQGSNINAQNYIGNWSNTVDSYLTKCTDGKYMLVQYDDNTGIVVEYYDSDFNRLSTQVLPEELPIFGAFYATDSNYYILTGQRNEEKSESVEGYRLTKYDLSWKRISSAGLYDCNTVVPFDAGSARITQLGKYLIVRTCHLMYNGHQANVTIEYDTESMKVTDSYTKVMNASVGYASHSFNQFITTENGKIVAVDHGDAYPRSIELFEYKEDASDGTFNGYCDYYSFFEIPGNIGDNFTGVRVGGFCTSDSTYLVAGSKINLDNFSSDRQYNIYVSTIDKTSKASNVNMITNYSTDKNGQNVIVSNPHFINVSKDKYMLLWTADNTLYYAYVNEQGQLASSIMSADGSLSDCVPLVTDGKVIWYTWNYGKVSFYSININDNKVSVKENTYGHNYELKKVSNDTASVFCNNCKISTTIYVPTKIEVWFERKGENYWYSVPESVYEAGETRKFYFVEYIDANNEYIYTFSDPEVMSVNDEGSYKEIKALKAGTTKFTITAKYNPSATKTFTINVKGGVEEETNKTTVESVKGLKISGRASNALRLNWESNENVDGYIIEQYKNNKWVRVKKIQNNKTNTYRISGLEAGTSYKFRIRAYKSYNKKPYYSGYETISDATIPSRVQNLAASSTAANAIRLNWNKDEDVEGYIIEQYKDGKWVRVKKFTSNSMATYKVSGLKTKTSYKFRIKSFKTIGKKIYYSGYTTIDAKTK